MCDSTSRYCIPFWMKVMSAPGGTFSPLMLDFAIMLSELKVKAEC